jgi:folate-dependent tRNA-U54 methylase TrmFO/GidA
VSHADPRNYQPTNITFGIMAAPPERIGGRRVGKAERKLATSERALLDLDAWIADAGAKTPALHAP